MTDIDAGTRTRNRLTFHDVSTAKLLGGMPYKPVIRPSHFYRHHYPKASHKGTPDVGFYSRARN